MENIANNDNLIGGKKLYDFFKIFVFKSFASSVNLVTSPAVSHEELSINKAKCIDTIDNPWLP